MLNGVSPLATGWSGKVLKLGVLEAIDGVGQNLHLSSYLFLVSFWEAFENTEKNRVSAFSTQIRYRRGTSDGPQKADVRLDTQQALSLYPVWNLAASPEPTEYHEASQ